MTRLHKGGKGLFRYLRISKSFTYGVVTIIILLILGYIVSLFAPFDPTRWGKVPRDKPPCLKYPLGTTTVGQDVFWLATYAIRNSFTLGVLTGFFSIVIASLMGFISGYLNEKLAGKLTNLVIDSFSVIPGLPYIMVLAFSFKEYLNMTLIALFLSTIGWAWPSKQLRSIILEIREKTHVYTARASGFSLFNIFWSEFLPYVLSWLATTILNLMKWAIGMETALGVFGLSSMEKATIGTTLYWAMNYQALLRGKWWWIGTPIVTVILIITSLYYISIGLGEMLNPRSRLAQLRRERIQWLKSEM